jgi:hypothetical protein
MYIIDHKLLEFFNFEFNFDKFLTIKDVEAYQIDINF